MILNANLGKEQLLQFKIVFWGPSGSGKTESFKRILEKLDKYKLNEGYSISTSYGSTLLQDSVHLLFKATFNNSNYAIIVQIVTTPGSYRFKKSRRHILGGADGIIFVADSDPSKIEDNFNSLINLENEINLTKIPCFIQLNKRDLDNAIPVRTFIDKFELNSLILDGDFNVYLTNSLKGDNIILCLRDILIRILFNYFNSFRKDYKLWLKFKEKQDPERIFEIISDKYKLEKYNLPSTNFGIERYSQEGGYTVKDSDILKKIVIQEEANYNEEIKWKDEYSKAIKTFGNAIVYFFGLNIEKDKIGRELWIENIGFERICKKRVPFNINQFETQIQNDITQLKEEYQYRTRLQQGIRRLLHEFLKKIKEILDSNDIECIL